MSLRACSRDPNPSEVALPAPRLRLHLFLLDAPEPLPWGRWWLTSLKGRKNAGLGGSIGQRPSCPQGRVAGSQGKAFALTANGVWVPGSLGVGRGAPSPYVHSPHSPLLLYQAVIIPTLSLPRAFLLPYHPDHLSRVTPHRPQSAKPRCHSGPPSYKHTPAMLEATIPAATRDDSLSSPQRLAPSETSSFERPATETAKGMRN